MHLHIFPRCKQFCLWGLIVLSLLIMNFAHADECSDELEAIQLPKELKVAPEALSYWQRSTEHRALLRSLARVLHLLNEAGTDLNEIAHFSREAISEKIDSNAVTPLPSLVTTPQIKERFFFLAQTTVGLKLDDRDLSLLAYLIKDVPERKIGDEFIDRGNIKTSDLKRQVDIGKRRIETLLVYPRYREIMAAIMLNRVVRSYFLYIWEIAGLNKVMLPTEKNLDTVTSRVLRGQLNRESLIVVAAIMNVFLLDLANLGEKMNIDSCETKNPVLVCLKRQGVLQAIEPYFAGKIGLKHGLDDLTALTDFFAFGTPLPPSLESIKLSIIDNAKALLLPLKADYAKHVTELQQQRHVSPTPTSSFNFSPRDLFKPSSEPRIKQKTRPHNDLTDDVSAEVSDHAITDENLSLRNFTSYQDSPRPVRDLDSSQTYLFWFLRDTTARIQKIRFSPQVLKWMQEDEISARQFLNALNLGRASNRGQSGLKMLARKSEKYQNPLFELKIKGPHRGLLVLEDGIWRFVSIVSKDHIDRKLESLTPL